LAASRYGALPTNNRFEDQATDILRTHARRLDTHRRSVILFYLFFGLITGFVIGIVGAKGAFATTTDGARMEFAGLSTSLLPSEISRRQPLAQRDDIDSLMTDGAAITAQADTGAEIGPERYAALLLADPGGLLTLTDAPSNPQPLPQGMASGPKSAIMGLLLLIFTIAATLSAKFMAHLNRAYAPRRSVRIGWPPRD
jgi:hypothetical protein